MRSGYWPDFSRNYPLSFSITRIGCRSKIYIYNKDLLNSIEALLQHVSLSKSTRFIYCGRLILDTFSLITPHSNALYREVSHIRCISLQWRHNGRYGVSNHIVYSSVYSGADQTKYQSSASLAFVRGIHWWPVNSPHKWPVTRKMFSFDDVIMSISHRHNPLSINISRLKEYPAWSAHLPAGSFPFYERTLTVQLSPCVAWNPHKTIDPNFIALAPKPGSHLNIKTVFPGILIYIIIIRRSWDLYNGNSYTGKTTFLYWVGPPDLPFLIAFSGEVLGIWMMVNLNVNKTISPHAMHSMVGHRIFNLIYDIHHWNTIWGKSS